MGYDCICSSLDQAGVITKSVSDAALFLQAISGYDAKDSTSINIESPAFSENLEIDLKGLKSEYLKNIILIY